MNTKRSFRQTNHKVHRTVSADFILPLIIAGCLTIAAHTANAATYYLDAANGNDSDSGTSEHPWKTMARAMTNWTGAGTKVAFGDTVYLRTGNYGIADFNFSPAISPSSWADAITYKAETGQLPVFSYLHIDQELSRYLIFDGISVTRTSEVVANVQACILVHSPSSLQFRNMNITGHWDTVVGGLLTTYGIQIDTVTVLQKQSDILIEDCNITNVAQGIYLNGGIVGSNIIIRNNIVHHTSNSSISIGSNTRTDEPNVILVESNYVYGPESIPQWYTVTHSNSIIGTFNNHERVTQDITGAIGKISEITTSSVTITPLSDGWTMGADYDIVGDVTGARLSDPNAITHTELTHASGIGLTTDNVTVRGNIIRNYAATSPLHTYPGWITVAKDGHKGYNNITIENNLVYDPFSANTTLLEEINSNCVIRNNTFIGYNLNPPNLSGYYYRSAFRLEQLPGSTGTKIYNNLIVGMAELSTTYPIVDVNQATKTFSVSGDHSADFISGSYLIVDSGGANSGTYHINGNAIYDGTNTLVVVSEAIPSATVAGSLKIPIPSTDYDEDYNLIYAVSSGGRWSSLLKGTHTQILSNGTTNPKTFDTGYFVNPNFSYSHGLVCDYRLQAGASAINFGDPNNQPSDSLGTVGPDGFIRDDGPAREATHHSAGCYEYAPTVLSFAPIGNKEVNEGSTLTFNIDINDPNVKTSIEEHNLPSEPNFINNIFSWTSAYEDAGSYEATFVAQNDLFEDFETIGIYVNNVNRSPVLAAISDKSVDENSLLNFLVSATDSDGDSITYSAANLPSEATFAGQTFNWTPDYNQSGTYQVTFTATDGQAQDWQTVNLTVNDVAAYVGTDAGTLLLNENFDRRSLADWLIIDEGKSCRSSWYAATRTLVQKSSIYTLSFPNQPGTYALYKNGSEWTNYQVSLTMKSGDSDSLGVMFRYKDSNNYYRFSWDKRRKTRQLVKNCDGIFTVLCRDSVPYLAGRYYQVNIIANGPDLQVLINNSPVLQTTDSSISSGSIAMYSWANSGSYFDNIVVRKF
jgi:hypothetical protein